MLAAFKARYVSLNEAVTRRAFGTARTPKQEFERHLGNQHQLRNRIIRCLAEAKGQAKYRDFPKQIPYWPVSDLIDLLEAHRKHWPASAADLHVYATQLLHDGAKSRYKEELNQLFSRASSGELEVVGRTGQHPSSSVVRINPEYFLGNATIDHTWKHIGPPIADEEDSKPGSILWSSDGLLPIYHDVRVLSENLGEFPTQPSLIQTAESASMDEIRSWYQRERQRLNESRTADEAAARVKYPKVRCLRHIIRTIRKELLRSRPGRPKFAKK